MQFFSNFIYYFFYIQDWTRKKGFYVYSTKKMVYPGDAEYGKVSMKEPSFYNDYGFKEGAAHLHNWINYLLWYEAVVSKNVVVQMKNTYRSQIWILSNLQVGKNWKSLMVWIASQLTIHLLVSPQIYLKL